MNSEASGLAALNRASAGTIIKAQREELANGKNLKRE
jgi:hypothetical protein